MKKFETCFYFLAALCFFVMTLSGCKSERQTWEYDLSPLQKVDSNLMTWNELPPLSLETDSPFAMAVDHEDRYFILDKTSLMILDPEGVLLNRILLNGKADALAVHPKHGIFLAQGRSVVNMAFDGSIRSEWQPLNENAIITAIAVTDSDVFLADAGNKWIWRHSPEGAFRNTIGGRDAQAGRRGFLIPGVCFDIQIGTQDELWAVNPGFHRLELFSPEGRLRSSWGKSGWTLESFSGCCNPTHFAIMPDGRFVTSEKGLVRIKIYDQTGTLESVAASPAMFDEGTEGLALAVDSKSRIIALDPARRQIRRFEEIKED